MYEIYMIILGLEHNLASTDEGWRVEVVGTVAEQRFLNPNNVQNYSPPV